MITELSGVKTHYQIIGKNKFPIVLLHGWACNWEIWSPVIGGLSEHFQLIIPDLPSLGKSETPQQVWTSQDFSQWLTTLIEHTVGNQPFALLGHSFGGKISSMYASVQPEHLSHLIVVDASGLPDTLSAPKQFQEKIFSLVPTSVKEQIPESFKRQFAQLTNSSADYRNATQYQRAVLKKILKEDLTVELQRIHVPTLLIWGKQDIDTPLHQGKQFHHLIPHSKLSIFEQSGHFPFIDEPTEFINVVKKFIS